MYKPIPLATPMAALMATSMAVLMAATLAVPAAAQKCTHQGIKTVPSKIIYGPKQTCGASLDIQVRGVTLKSPASPPPSGSLR